MIQIVPFGGWERSLRLCSGDLELIATLEVGPRVISLRRGEGPNVFCTLAEELGGSGEGEWRLRGGHRFWTAPEGGACYAPDNGPVQARVLGEFGAALDLPRADGRSWSKSLVLSAAPDEPITVRHRLRNEGTGPLALTPWGVTALAPEGEAIVPQPALARHPGELEAGSTRAPSDLWPNRRLVLWRYTDLADERFDFGPRSWTVRHSRERGATKIGTLFAEGWVGYRFGEWLFAKWIDCRAGARYPDDGCNLEIFANARWLELESLAPLEPLAPGQTREHVELWRLERLPAAAGTEEAREVLAGLPRP